METLRYLGLAAAFGLLAVWVSENLFWIVPPPGISLPDLAFTWLAYATACACVLSALIWTGAGGWRGAFLGGALLGYLVEGVVVGTIYDAFPVQLVWTPLAWHGLVTGLVFTAGLRAPLSPGRALALWLAVGLVLTLWALYWPTERAVLPGTGGLLLYLGLPGMAVVAALQVIDRCGDRPPQPPRAVLWVAPGLALALFAAQTVLAPDPRRLVLPPIIAGLLWLMRRSRGGWGVARAPLYRAIVLTVPLTIALLAPPLWAAFGPVATNVPVALASGLAACGLLVWIALRPARR